MLKKILTAGLAMIVLTVASSVPAFARKSADDGNQPVAERKNDSKTIDFKAAIKTKEEAGGLNISNKSTLAEYERAKKQARGFSTTTKVLIGVGIAAAVVGIVVFAASRDKIRTF